MGTLATSPCNGEANVLYLYTFPSTSNGSGVASLGIQLVEWCWIKKLWLVADCGVNLAFCNAIVEYYSDQVIATEIAQSR